MSTFMAKAESVKRDWFVIDADGKVLGRLATEVARRLRGKHKPEFTPHCDTGDYIVVINAAKVRATGNKLEGNDGKIYWRHTGHPGGIKQTNLKDMLDKHPERVIEKAVKGMLPKGPLGYAQFRKLKVYADDKHPHASQQPTVLKL